MVSRRKLLLGSGALALAAGCGDEEGKTTAEPRGDVDVVRFLLPLEHVASDFWEGVAGSDVLRGPELQLARRIHADEREHVQELQDLVRKLGGPAEARSATDLSGVLAGGRRGLLRAAVELEDTLAGAYLGQLAEIRSRTVLAQALAIHSVEGRHAAALRRLAGEPFLPDGAFAVSLPRAEVTRRLERYLA